MLLCITLPACLKELFFVFYVLSGAMARNFIFSGFKSDGQAVVNALGRALEWKKAVDLPNEMMMQRLAPTTVTLNSAISACEKAHRWEWALHVLSEACLLFVYFSSL